MKKEKLLKLGLTEELAQKVAAASTEELKGFIPKIRFDEVNNYKKELEKQIINRDIQLVELIKKAKENENLEKTIIELHNAYGKTKADCDAKINDIIINAAIQSKLTEIKYGDLLMGKFDRAGLSIAVDGTVLGIDEQLQSIKVTYNDLFTPIVAGRQSSKEFKKEVKKVNGEHDK